MLREGQVRDTPSGTGFDAFDTLRGAPVHQLPPLQLRYDAQVCDTPSGNVDISTLTDVSIQIASSLAVSFQTHRERHYKEAGP